MEDFDYIGTGGFLIECKDGEVLGVTKEQGEFLQQESQFFQKCFSSPMLEGQQRQVSKPDWSLQVVRHLVELMTKGRTTLANLRLYEQMVEAADQALVSACLCNFVNYVDPIPPTSHQRFLDLVQGDYFRFRLRSRVSSQQWIQLLEQGVLLRRVDTNYVLQLSSFQEEELSPEDAFSRRSLALVTTDYLVNAQHSLQAILALGQIIAKDLQTKTPTVSVRKSDQFSLYFETVSDFASSKHVQLISFLTGGIGYERTCADDSPHSTEGHTIRASIDVLSRAIRPLESTEPDIMVTLRMDHPTPDTLGRFINACCSMDKDYHGIVNLHIRYNRYYCQLPLSKTVTMLGCLGDYSFPAKTTPGSFTVVVDEDSFTR